MVIYTSEKNSIAIKWQYRNHENSRLVKQENGKPVNWFPTANQF